MTGRSAERSRPAAPSVCGWTCSSPPLADRSRRRPAPSRRSAAPLPASPGRCPARNGTTFNLKATTGRISTARRRQRVHVGLREDARQRSRCPVPILCVTQGATSHRQLSQNDAARADVSIVFPGRPASSASGGAARPARRARRPPAPGGTVTTASSRSEPGTYLYESGTNPHKQVQMGLYGALIVRPTMRRGLRLQRRRDAVRPGPRVPGADARHRPDCCTDAVERNQPYDVTTKHDRYWTINGRSFPDTIAADGVALASEQPYGALVRVAADDRELAARARPLRERRHRQPPVPPARQPRSS